jgi:hypothetical protein
MSTEKEYINKCSICKLHGHQSRTCGVLERLVQIIKETIENGESWLSIKSGIQDMIKEYGISVARKVATNVVNTMIVDEMTYEFRCEILEEIQKTRKPEFLSIFEDIYKQCHPSNTVDVNSEDFDIFDYADMLAEENKELKNKMTTKSIKMIMSKNDENWINTDVCGICLETTNSKTSVSLGCKHGFCADCVSQLLKRDHTNCPSCRQEVSSISFCKTISNKNFNLIQDSIYS